MRCPALHLRIVSGSTMNYNAYNVVETAYETFALVVAARCFCFAYRLRGRAACSPNQASIAISGRDAVSLSAAAAALRYQRRPAASSERYSGSCAATDRCDREQADEMRPAVRNPRSEQAWLCHEPLCAEFWLRGCPRFPTWDRGQGSVHAENLPRSLTDRQGRRATPSANIARIASDAAARRPYQPAALDKHINCLDAERRRRQKMLRARTMQPNRII
jgi:hypothetical protein